LRGGIAHLLANCRSLGVPVLGLFDGVSRDPTGPGVVLEALDELGLRAQEVLEQLAGFLNGCLVLVGLLDGRAVLLDLVAHCQKLAARGRRPLLRATKAAPTRHPAGRAWHPRHAAKLPISRERSGNHKGRKQKGPADRHGTSSSLSNRFGRNGFAPAIITGF